MLIKNPILEIKDLTVHFGGIIALNKVSFKVEKSSITALIGPNGAGKTTLFNCLTGFYKATSGSILLNTDNGRVDIVKVLGEPLKASDFINPVALASRLRYKMFGGSYLIARAGIARTFQNIRLFHEMTAMENLLVAQHMTINKNLVSGLLNLKSFKEAEDRAINKAYTWLDIMDLRVDANRFAKELPYGHQRRLEIARAMCTDPGLICLDEPAAGLNPRETDELSLLVRRLRDEFNVTVFIIEHDMTLVMDISEHIVVLNYGQVIANNDPQSIRKDKAVLSAYLGMNDDD